MKIFRKVVLGLGLFALPVLLHAQLTVQSIQPIELLPPVQSSPDSVVAVTADAYGLSQIAPADLPLFGTYWVVYPNGVMPPFPCAPQDLSQPIYAITDDIFLVDQTGGQVSPNPRWLARTMNVSAMSSTEMVTAAVDQLGNSVADLIERIQGTQYVREMAMSLGMDIPMPGGGGGGGDYTNSYFGIQMDTNQLWLEIASQSNIVSSLVIHPPWNMGDSNFMYDFFATTNLLPGVPGLNGTNWLYVTRSLPGQTNLVVSPLTGADICFFRLGTMQDSDGDGLPDAFENLVSHTDPSLWDSNGNGISDGDEISPSGLPWRLVLARASSVVIFANSPVATQGGVCGQCTVYLPTPAPAGGVTVQYYLGGSAVLDGDYAVSPSAGQVFIPAGYSTGSITVCALGTNSYSDLNLYADITLTNAAGYAVDGTPAEVSITDTGSPGIRVYALPQWTRRPCSTYGTNAAGFYFIRDGDATNTLTVNLSASGTATSGTDYSALPASITFSNNVRTNWLPLTIIANGTNPADKSLTVTISNAPGYQIDPANGAATVTIAATASPVLPVVQVTNSITIATTNASGQFTFTRSFATANPLRVFFHAWNYTNSIISGSTNGDVATYTALPGYVDIPANATSVNASLAVLHQLSVVQPVTVTLAAGDYAIGTNNAATVTIDAVGSTAISVVQTRSGSFGGSQDLPVELTFIRSGSTASPLTLNWFNVTNGTIGYKINTALMSGNYNQGQIQWAVGQSVVKTYLYVTYYRDPFNPPTGEIDLTPSITFSNAIYYNSMAVRYLPQWRMVKIYDAASYYPPYTNRPATLITNGTTANAVVISRPYVYSVSQPIPAPQWTTVNLTLSGSAANGVDFTMNTSVFIDSNQTQVIIPVTALNATNQGWRTLVVSVNPSDYQTAPVGSDTAFVRLANPNNLVDDTDMDGDGIPDGFELNNLASGLDPLTPNNPYADVDRDGLGVMEELSLGLNPLVADAPPTYPSIDDSDYVSLTMRVTSSGKMLTEPVSSCAVCHAVTMRAGSFIASTSKTDWTHNPQTADYVARLARGSNYQVQVTCNPFASSLLTSNQAAATTTPKYTAAYTAQLLADTNGTPWPFIVDTNRLLGTNQPMVREVLPKRATLYVPDLTIATDNDRDGVVDFANRNDRTSTNNPFTFWINDDCDSGSDDTAADLDPTNPANTLNCNNNTIDGLRDLEDFARLQFKIDGLPPQFLTNYQVKVYLTNLVGTPSVRLFPAADTDGGLGYLTNTTTATTQVGKTMLGVVTSDTPLTIASSAWQSAGTNSFFLPMIFECISTGQCVIMFGFSTNNQPPAALSRPFYLTLKRVTDLYEHWTMGDNTNTDWHDIPQYPARTADSAVFGVPQKQEDMDYIVFVHGWRMQPWERRAFASTAYKRLWHLGYKGRFGLYSWPTDYIGNFWDFLNPIDGTNAWQNYDRSEQRAWKSGIGLFELLADLNEAESPNRVRLLAHSMGNIVASEALRLANVIGVSLPLVQSYIASQAASVAHAYDATNPAKVTLSFLYRTPEIYASFPRNGITNAYFTGMKKAVLGTNIFNFNNVQDYALNTAYAWPQNQANKPDSGWKCQLVATNRINTNNWYTFWRGNTKLDMNQGSEASHDQTYEIFAHIAQAESAALGCAEDPTHHIRGEISGTVDLNAAPFNYRANTYEHSAQFNSINMNRRTYWWQVLLTFSLTNNLPLP